MQVYEFHTTAKNGIIQIPSEYKSKIKSKIKVIILSDENSSEIKKNLVPLMKESSCDSGQISFTESEIDTLFKGSLAESLIGVVPDTGQTLEDYRAERLKKYECTD